MKRVISLMIFASLVGCGGGGGRAPSENSPYRVSSSGPINKACMASDRKARSPQLCSCIQSAANAKLTASEQRRAVQFYGDPHKAQETRQSSRASDERFWRKYRDYVDYAEALCS